MSAKTVPVDTYRLLERLDDIRVDLAVVLAAAPPAEPVAAITKLSQTEYDSLVKDAMRWRAQICKQNAAQQMSTKESAGGIDQQGNKRAAPEAK